MSSNFWVLLDNPVTRTEKLGKQLILKWSLFTRNTIWGSLMIWGTYQLPWNEKTNNYELAVVYDLNNIRLWNYWCEKIIDWEWNETEECINENNFIIKYDPLVQNNPPKLFSK